MKESKQVGELIYLRMMKTVSQQGGGGGQMEHNFFIRNIVNTFSSDGGIVSNVFVASCTHFRRVALKLQSDHII